MVLLGAALLAWCALVGWVARDARRLDTAGVASASLLMDGGSTLAETVSTGFAGIAAFLFVVVPAVAFLLDSMIDAADGKAIGAILLALGGVVPAAVFGVVYGRARARSLRPVAAFRRATLTASPLGLPLLMLLVIASAAI